MQVLAEAIWCVHSLGRLLTLRMGLSTKTANYKDTHSALIFFLKERVGTPCPTVLSRLKFTNLDTFKTSSNSTITTNLVPDLYSLFS